MWMMMFILLLALGLFTLFIKTSLNMAAKYVSRTTKLRHQDAEYILEHRLPPPAWKQRTGADKPQKYFNRDLDALIRYFSNAPVFDSEETRQMLLNDLKKIHGEWDQSTEGRTAHVI
jgi:hypothetical protein